MAFGASSGIDGECIHRVYWLFGGGGGVSIPPLEQQPIAVATTNPLRSPLKENLSSPTM